MQNRDKILDILFNSDWTIEEFDTLGLDDFTNEEKYLFLVCKDIKSKGLEISAVNILKFSGKEMMVLYMDLVNFLDSVLLERSYQK